MNPLVYVQKDLHVEPLSQENKQRASFHGKQVTVLQRTDRPNKELTPPAAQKSDCLSRLILKVKKYLHQLMEGLKSSQKRQIEKLQKQNALLSKECEELKQRLCRQPPILNGSYLSFLDDKKRAPALVSFPAFANGSKTHSEPQLPEKHNPKLSDDRATPKLALTPPPPPMSAAKVCLSAEEQHEEREKTRLAKEKKTRLSPAPFATIAFEERKTEMERLVVATLSQSLSLIPGNPVLIKQLQEAKRNLALAEAGGLVFRRAGTEAFKKALNQLTNFELQMIIGLTLDALQDQLAAGKETYAWLIKESVQLYLSGRTDEEFITIKRTIEKSKEAWMECFSAQGGTVVAFLELLSRRLSDPIKNPEPLHVKKMFSPKIDKKQIRTVVPQTGNADFLKELATKGVKSLRPVSP